MFETFKNAFKVPEIRKKLIITLLILLAFRLCCFIPVPGLNPIAISSILEGNDFFALLNSITGQSLENGTIFALGISPYINASIIVQLLCVGIPSLEALSKQGEEGKKKISNITKVIMVILAIVQSIGTVAIFQNTQTEAGDSALRLNFFFNQTWLAYVVITIVFTAGACITMWFGDRITDYGIGNGISLIIFVGLISTAGSTIIEVLSGITSTDMSGLYEVIGFIALAVVIFALIVLVDLAERRVPVQYAKQVKGRKMYGGQSSVIPIKISAGGVMPLIFAYAIISFPGMIMNLFWPNSSASTWWSTNFSQGTWAYVLVLSLLIFGFSFFYAQISFNPEDISKNIQSNGGFIQGIRPGKPTADYLKKISNRITLFGAIYLALVAFLPSLIFALVLGSSSQLVSVFSATGLLIIVSVALEFNKQLESQLMMRNYKGFLK